MLLQPFYPICAETQNADFGFIRQRCRTYRVTRRIGGYPVSFPEFFVTEDSGGRLCECYRAAVLLRCLGEKEIACHQSGAVNAGEKDHRISISVPSAIAVGVDEHEGIVAIRYSDHRRLDTSIREERCSIGL